MACLVLREWGVQAVQIVTQDNSESESGHPVGWDDCYERFHELGVLVRLVRSVDCPSGDNCYGENCV